MNVSGKNQGLSLVVNNLMRAKYARFYLGYTIFGQALCFLNAY